MEEIKLYSTEQLIDELETRFHATVFIGLELLPKGKDNDVQRVAWNGGQAVCVGLCEIVKNKIVAQAIGGLYEDTP